MILSAFKASGVPRLGSFLEKGMNSEELFDCLTSQTLQYESKETIGILLRLALLDDFRVDELPDIFGIDTGETLDVALARNLYLTKTITGSGTVFRFHSL